MNLAPFSQRDRLDMNNRKLWFVGVIIRTVAMRCIYPFRTR